MLLKLVLRLFVLKHTVSIWRNLTQASRPSLLSSPSAFARVQDYSVLSTSPCRCQVGFQQEVFKELYEEESFQE